MLPVESWQPTRDTLTLWLQVVGKIRIARTPLINHWWNAPLYLTSRGLTTSLMPAGTGRSFSIDLDFLEHRLDATTTRGQSRSMELCLERVFNVFRARFVGKSSPVHLFWGALDLATTRFSGRTAPPHPGGLPNCGPHVMHEAYSHEVSCCG